MIFCFLCASGRRVCVGAWLCHRLACLRCAALFIAFVELNRLPGGGLHAASLTDRCSQSRINTVYLATEYAFRAQQGKRVSASAAWVTVTVRSWRSGVSETCDGSCMTCGKAERYGAACMTCGKAERYGAACMTCGKAAAAPRHDRLSGGSGAGWPVVLAPAGGSGAEWPGGSGAGWPGVLAQNGRMVLAQNGRWFWRRMTGGSGAGDRPCAVVPFDSRTRSFPRGETQQS